MVRLLCACIALIALAFPSGDDEIVKEFKKYFRKYKDTATRVEAILALEGTDTAGVVRVLVPILKDKDSDVVGATVRVLSGLEDPAAIEVVFDRLAAEKDGRVLSGLLEVIARGEYVGPTEVLVELLEDRAWRVRRQAVFALSTGFEPTAAETIAPLCDDTEPGVRCAALEGLARLGAESAVDRGLEALDDEVWQVRASAIAALHQVRRKRAIAPLIERLEMEEGRLQDDIAAALADLTGRRYGRRIELWQRFWGQVQERFVVPTDEELAKLRAKQKANAELYTPAKATVYHGIDTPSRAVVFVIDVSGSMETLVVDTDRFKDGDYPSFQRIDIVKTELARTIEALEPYVEFNVLAFATKVDPWKKGLVKANVLNKSSALEWVRRLEAIGGSSKSDLAAAGLVGSANLEAGKTNTHAALMAALGASSVKQRDDYEVEIDTIFFLSDGRPSHGEYVDPDDILREVKALNDLRKIVIHTIALGEFQKEFMKRLAEENGGVFVDLGN